MHLGKYSRVFMHVKYKKGASSELNLTINLKDIRVNFSNFHIHGTGICRESNIFFHEIKDRLNVH